MSTVLEELTTVPKRDRRTVFPVMATAGARAAAEALVAAGWLAPEPVLEVQVEVAIRRGRRRFVLPGLGLRPEDGHSFVPLSDDGRTVAIVRPAPSRYTHDVVWLVTSVERPALPLARPSAYYRPIPWSST